jgi:four helix bundle protein
MKENIVKEKSYQFALDVIQAYRLLGEEHKEYILSKQLLRSGTSIGPMFEEALAATAEKL